MVKGLSHVLVSPFCLHCVAHAAVVQELSTGQSLTMERYGHLRYLFSFYVFLLIIYQYLGSLTDTERIMANEALLNA